MKKRLRKKERRENPDLDSRKEVTQLFANLKRKLPKLEKLLAECNDMWGVEDCVYRFYHQSFKLFMYQELTEDIVKELKALLPGRPLNKMFVTIVESGTGIDYEAKHDENWLGEPRQIVDTFLHARFFLEMAVKYGRDLEFPPNSLPSGWAVLLYLYDLR
ncbi:MAG: hypothetical protein NTW87_26565 [Planctomycetota bacterium]|nr:hypothetical protein [Planctomycetota bacterium]